MIILLIINSVKHFNTKNINIDIGERINALRIAIYWIEEELKNEDLTSLLSEVQIQMRRDTISVSQDKLNQLESDVQQNIEKYLIPKEPLRSNSSGSEEKEAESSSSLCS